MELLTKKFQKIKQHCEDSIHTKEVEITALLSQKALLEKLIKDQDAAVLRAFSFLAQARDSLTQINDELEKIIREDKEVLAVDSDNESIEKVIHLEKDKEANKLLLEKNLVDHIAKMSQLIYSISGGIQLLSEAKEAFEQVK